MEANETASRRDTRRISWQENDPLATTSPTSSNGTPVGGGVGGAHEQGVGERTQNLGLGWADGFDSAPEVQMQVLAQVGRLVRAAARRGGQHDTAQCEECPSNRSIEQSSSKALDELTYRSTTRSTIKRSSRYAACFFVVVLDVCHSSAEIFARCSFLSVGTQYYVLFVPLCPPPQRGALYADLSIKQKHVAVADTLFKKRHTRSNCGATVFQRH